MTSMTQLSPYIYFNGRCKEAMHFYHTSLGGELHLQTIAGSPIEAQCPVAMHELILHGTLIKEGICLMGTDMQGADTFTQGNNIAISINCSSEAEIRLFFKNLSAAGEIIEDLKQQFWGGQFGVLTDQFGLRWMFNYEPK
jgi:PhnB protein